MNLLVLLAGLRPWSGAPLSIFARAFAAIALLSLEMQAVTWWRVGTLRTLVFLNTALALGTLWLWRPAREPESTASRPSRFPWTAVLLLGSLVLVLNLGRPMETADPYHLQRAMQIERLGTLEYDIEADPKVNVLGWAYELVLADLGQVPVAGPVLVRLHGVLGLVFYALAVAAVRQWLPGGPTWMWGVLFSVPVLFHQFVLIKNDLFGAVPAFVALCWFVVRARKASCAEIAWAGSLVGFSVAMKLTSFPLAVVAAGVVLVERRERWRPFACLLLGGALGSVAGGLPFMLVQNARWYGDALRPLADLGNRHTNVADALVGVGRFATSLFDFGLLTPSWWPDRGGWGTTFGAPLIWALASLVAHWRTAPEARRALVVAGASFLLFASVYPDADIAHRLTLAAGLLPIAVAVHLVGQDGARASWLRAALVAVLVISSAQIARSAALYWLRSTPENRVACPFNWDDLPRGHSLAAVRSVRMQTCLTRTWSASVVARSRKIISVGRIVSSSIRCARPPRWSRPAASWPGRPGSPIPNC